MSKKKNFLLITAILLVSALLYAIWANTALVTTEIEFAGVDLPAEFDGLRIAHISDTHDCEFGPDNIDLVEAVHAARPDIIVITGDIIDSKRTDIQRAVSLGAQLAEIAPTYYSSGNHEALLSDEEYSALISGLSDSGVTVLDNSTATVTSGEASITIVGTRDIGFLSGDIDGRVAATGDFIYEYAQENDFVIALAHRPEFFETYISSGADLTLSGHAHGGQVRLPFIGGLAAPGQGILPEYDAGLFAAGGNAMIVSRGLGNSIIPLRINNRPEIVMITLTAQ